MRLPRTSTNRRDRGFLRLLSDVDAQAPLGLQFRGQRLTPGAQFDPADLPHPAVLLEYAGRVRVAPVVNSRYSFEAQWVLWRFNFEAGAWVEVIRALSCDAGWSMDFAPVAYRLLYANRTDTAADRARPESERVTAQLRRELSAMTREMRCHVLAALDVYVSSEIVRSSPGPLTLREAA
jgi:hypothetical protein